MPLRRNRRELQSLTRSQQIPQAAVQQGGAGKLSGSGRVVAEAMPQFVQSRLGQGSIEAAMNQVVRRTMGQPVDPSQPQPSLMISRRSMHSRSRSRNRCRDLEMVLAD